MSEEQSNIAQHTLALPRKMDTKLDEVLLRLSVVELRQRVERIERRLELTD